MSEQNDPVSNIDVRIPEHIQEQLDDLNSLDATTLIGHYQPTAHLRIVVPAGTHSPDQQELQQLWRAPLKGGGFTEQWRPIPKEIV